MKKLFLFVISALMALPTLAQRSPSHPLDIQDAKFSDLAGYMDAWFTGSQERPTGVSEMDDQFYISRVRKLPRIKEGDYQVRPEVPYDRKMCLWLPLDDPTTQWKSLPRYCFEGDNFSLWSYVDIHGNWTAPWFRSTAGITDVAHKNGVNVGTLMSIPWSQYINLSWGYDDYSQIFKVLTQKDVVSGEFKYVKPFVKMLHYYGIEGIGVNSEFRAYQSTMTQIIDFFVACHKEAKAQGYDFQVYWYDGTNDNGNIAFDQGLNSSNSKMFGDKDNICTDMMFANYNWTTSLLKSSVAKAEELGRSSYDYYAGFDIQGRALNQNYWQGLIDNKISVGFWGAHAQSLIHQSATDDGTADIAIQKAYLKKQELIFSGGYRNPAVTPNVRTNASLSNADLAGATGFHGLARLISAKSTIQQLPFVSRFNLGNGLKFRNKGVVTFDHKWYNINTQDYMPTWRWWITNRNDQATTADLAGFVDAELSFDDAYFGGSCLSLSGKTDYSRVKLFKTLLDVQGSDELSIVYKMKGNTQTHARLFVSLSGALTDYKAIDIPAASATDKWVEFKAPLSKLGVTGGKVALIGIEVEGAPEDYQMYVGELALRRPGQSFGTVAPAIKEIQVLRGRYNACDFKMRYSAKDETERWVKTYNDEVGTWYYEIWFQQQGQEPQLLTATTSWAAYVIDAPMIPGADKRQCRFGVRPVDPSGSDATPITWSDYQEVAYDDPISDVETNKAIVKPGEEFVLRFVDTMQPAAQKWEVVDPLTGKVVASAENSTECKAQIDKVGLYDLIVTDSKGNKTTLRGKVQVTPEETGAVPSIDDVTADKSTAKADEEVTFTYRGKKGEGSVSRALEITDPNMFMVPGDVQQGKVYSYALWFKADKFSHDKQGTNLINKNSIADKWPHNNWGDLWVTIRPEWTGKATHAANEISFNVMGWTAHDNPNEDMMSTGYQVTPGIWNHVVVTEDANNVQKLYFNGKKVAETTFSASTRRENLAQSDSRIDASVVANIFIGGGGVYKAGFVGAIDEFQVWDKALSDEEVIQAMQGYSEGNIPDGLQAYYTFETMNADGTFPNLGKAGEKPGKVVVMEDSGGESTSTAAYVQKSANNNLMGYPGIEGSLPVTATLDWDLGVDGVAKAAEGNNQVAVYGSAGKKTVTLTVKNLWGEAQLTKEEIVEITGESTGINAVENGNGGLQVRTYADHVVLRFAEAGNYSVAVYNTAGAVVARQKVNAKAGELVRLNISAPQGTYLLRVQQGGKQLKALKLLKR